MNPNAEVGHPAPDFELPASDGKTYKLSDFKGKKPVVLAWYPKADTPGCTKECQSLKASKAALAGTGAMVFGASVDGVAANQAFAEKLGLQAPLLCDADKKVATAYGVLGPRGVAQRWTFYIDKEGVLKHVDKQVKPQNHGADIAAQAKKLGWGG